ncbi:dehydrogenase-like protein [Meredithblackwellia eburnea MCA 4105]
MKALVLKGAHKIVHQDDSGDAIVEYTGLCGSDLHWYRGHQKWDGSDVVLGHEFVGTVIEVGTEVSQFKPMWEVLLLPSGSYITLRATGQFQNVMVFGTASYPGVQSEFARVAQADSTLVKSPEGMSPKSLILMADIFPTGFWVARNGFSLLQEKEKRKDSTALVIGCGPVGLCAITAASEYFGTVYALDPVAARREQAEKHGAIACSPDDVEKVIMAATDGRGVDSCLEVVGNAGALDLALKYIRPFGSVASCGVHAGDSHDGDPAITRQQLYNKNARIQFGRCPVRAVFDDALEVLKKHDKIFEDFVQHIVPMSKGAEYFELFEQQKILKTIFVPGQ